MNLAVEIGHDAIETLTLIMRALDALEQLSVNAQHVDDIHPLLSILNSCLEATTQQVAQQLAEG